MRKKTIEIHQNPLSQINLIARVNDKLREEEKEEQRRFYIKAINNANSFEDVVKLSEKYYKIIIIDDNTRQR